MPHKTTTVIIDGKPVEVDEKIAMLVDILNQAGLKTLHSCEGAVINDNGILDLRKRAYISIEATPSVSFEFKSNRLILRWALIPD